MSRQSCWSLFFSFSFRNITYSPGSKKNTKAVALFRQYSTDQKPKILNVIQPSCIVALPLEIKDQVLVAHWSAPYPRTWFMFLINSMFLFNYCLSLNIRVLIVPWILLSDYYHPHYKSPTSPKPATSSHFIDFHPSLRQLRS